MNEAKRRLLLGVLKLFDVSLVFASFSFATILVISESGTVSPSEFLAMRIKVGNFVLFGVVLICWHILFSSCGLYETRRLSSRRSEVIDLLKATSYGIAWLWFIAALFNIRMVTLSFLGVFWALLAISLMTSRLIMRYVLKQVRTRGRNLRFMLILGTNHRAIECVQRIAARQELGYRILGFVDNDWEGMKEFQKTGYSLCCNLDGVADFLRRNVVDEVAIYLPLRSFHERASQLAALCEQHGVILRFDFEIFNLTLARPRVEDFDGAVHVTTFAGIEGWPVLVKWILDFTVSLVLLILFSPLFFIVGLVIKLTSNGPVFFVQERVGLNKRRILVYKFRTMVLHAEKMRARLEALNDVSGPVFKIMNDPRVTPVGKFLRRTSIDELPQLFNVLKGEMSLVGPRPLPVRDYEGFNEDWQRRRFSVRPGITCLWQINGRSAIPFEKWMELDIQYIDKWSLWLDLKILARTIPAVLRGTGAV
jgi:exopolysaccharide biosynthesis polyprenyl glycosylphosphotransferase